RLGGVGFIIDLEVFQFPAAQLAALLGHVQLEAVLDGVAQSGIRAAVGQHESDLDLVGRRGAAGGQGQGAGEQGAVQGIVHGLSPRYVGWPWAQPGRFRLSTKPATAVITWSGWSLCGECPQSPNSISCAWGSARLMPRICSSVPYSPSGTRSARTGQRMRGRSVRISQARNAGSSQMSFHPQKAESTSAW